jgi:hypothetical protein
MVSLMWMCATMKTFFGVALRMWKMKWVAERKLGSGMGNKDILILLPLLAKLVVCVAVRIGNEISIITSFGYVN